MSLPRPPSWTDSCIMPRLFRLRAEATDWRADQQENPKLIAANMRNNPWKSAKYLQKTKTATINHHKVVGFEAPSTSRYSSAPWHQPLAILIFGLETTRKPMSDKGSCDALRASNPKVAGLSLREHVDVSNENCGNFVAKPAWKQSGNQFQISWKPIFKSFVTKY